jgi:branched-chain amino acid transport system permease protein
VDTVNLLMPASLVRSAELLVDQWWSAAVDGVVQGVVYALLAVACTRRGRGVDLAPLAGFALGLFAAYLTYLALGFRPGPTPDVGALPLLGFLVLGLVAAVVAATAATAATSGSLLFGLIAFAVVELGLWLLLGADARSPVRLFRPHELVPDVDDVQLAVVGLAVAAFAVALRRGVRPVVASGLLAGVAAFLYLLKVPGSAGYLTAVLVGVYAVTAAVLGRTATSKIVAAVVLGLVQVCFETAVGARWWLPFSLGLLVLAVAVRELRDRSRARKSAVPVAEDDRTAVEPG